MGVWARREHIPIGRSRNHYWYWLFVLSNESGKVGNGGESNGTNQKRQVLSSAAQVRFNQALLYLGS